MSRRLQWFAALSLLADSSGTSSCWLTMTILTAIAVSTAIAASTATTITNVNHHNKFWGLGGVLETAGTVLDRGESANCIPSLGFGFGPTVFCWIWDFMYNSHGDWVERLGKWVILDRFRRCLVLHYRGDWELSVTGHRTTQKFIVVVPIKLLRYFMSVHVMNESKIILEIHSKAVWE